LPPSFTFGREKNLVAEAFHGSTWWTNERYTGAKVFDSPAEWKTYTGHYRSDSPWYGSTRVLIRKGALLIDGSWIGPQGLFNIGPSISFSTSRRTSTT